ncbi:copper chaperone CopZ [Neobacillus sp. C211]|jgi:copper chaperone|uniref:Copper chaperone CopZ n=1 Tax=Priestia megaterium TaxID=1404 RepID=A0A6H1P7M2_PRIMG|nr:MULTISPECIES: copper chaperone CopZ [Bacillaceae]MBT2699277.1 copper chaperone CopZ [Bacillus sp. ISL-40]MBT2723455.1 copper chaperone CopZ [Bacillus sp. ISL-46]MBT2726902.1 copper chaperone CopZ [Bacillus sp. ISL-75]MBT2737099.1 copper chaperone CopZ [Bacillus sp. ISL-7]MBT2739863.1 copper chaperone CopZ [Bacillus sp. ISL-77]
MEKTTLQVTGMTCGHCEKAVKTALLNLEGVTEVNVSLKDGKVMVGHDLSKASVGKLKEAVEDQGYDVG